MMLGNLSTMDICNRLGISLPSDVVEALESIRSDKDDEKLLVDEKHNMLCSKCFIKKNKKGE